MSEVTVEAIGPYEDTEYFVSTHSLRWQRRRDWYGRENLILQQAQQGSKGTVRWEDVPIEDYAK